MKLSLFFLFECKFLNVKIYNFCFFIYFCFLVQAYSLAQVNSIVLPCQLPQCWGDKCVPPHSCDLCIIIYNM